jgi:cleavage stimulation factor subunit 2
VFIGNIPFDLSEEQLIDIFKEVGPITNFRLMFDKDTGKPRGFAFCEYPDSETAGSAIRNLNGFDVGGRHLKVDYADSEMPSAAPSGHSQSMFHQGFQQPFQQLPQEQQQHVYANSLEEINATLAGMSNQQLIDLISQAKALAIANPEQARLMLQSNPQMTFALFQAMLQTNLVEQRVVQQIMHSLPKHADHKPEQPPKAPIDQQQVIKQIMGLTEEQISALPAEQQSQVRAFRTQYGGNVEK